MVIDFMVAYLEFCSGSGESPWVLRVLCGEFAVYVGRVVCLVEGAKADVVGLSVNGRVRSLCYGRWVSPLAATLYTTLHALLIILSP